MTVAALLEGTPAVAARIVGDASASIGGDGPRLPPDRPGRPVLLPAGRARRRAPLRRRGGGGRGRSAAGRPPRSTSASPQVVVADTRAAMGPLAATLLGPPVAADDDVGVTGTNGKTTTTHLLAAVLDAAGWPTGVIGTLTGAHTTPEAPELQAPPGRAAPTRAGGPSRWRSRRTPSAMHRVDGTRFAVAGLHQPRARPPRLPRDDGALLRRQGRAVRRRTWPTAASSTSTTCTAGCWSTSQPSR